MAGLLPRECETELLAGAALDRFAVRRDAPRRPNWRRRTEHRRTTVARWRGGRARGSLAPDPAGDAPSRRYEPRIAAGAPPSGHMLVAHAAATTARNGEPGGAGSAEARVAARAAAGRQPARCRNRPPRG